MSARLPEFFIVGAPKAGTTSLYRHLAECPGVYMSPIKEPCYFAPEMRLNFFDAKYQAKACGDLPALHAYLNGPMTERRDGGIVSEWEDYLKLFRNAGAARLARRRPASAISGRALPRSSIASAVPAGADHRMILPRSGRAGILAIPARLRRLGFHREQFRGTDPGGPA